MTRIALAALCSLLLPLARATHLTDDRLQKVWDLMQSMSTFSWENGTRSQALLEYNYPSLSVIASDSPFPLPASLNVDQFPLVYDIAQVTMENRPISDSTSDPYRGASLLSDGAAGDPASLGVAVLMTNQSTDNAQVKGIGYGTAATEELQYLLYDVPRTQSGAISHRADQAQLWSDSVYMVPPFLAYYGVLQNNQSLVQQAYEQISIYRGHMKGSNNLWKHIIFGSQFLDPGYWATGNAWVVAGILRVLATIKKSPFASEMQQQQVDLQNWAEEVLTASNGFIGKSDLLHNYIDNSSTFEDCTASALMAAAGYRMSTLGLSNNYVNMSTTLLAAVSAKVNSTGYVTQVTDPYSFTTQGTESPEAQSFVVMAYAAFNAWNASGRPGGPSGDGDPLGKYSGAPRLSVPVGLAVALAAALSTII